MSTLITRKLFTVSDVEQMEKAGILGEDDRLELIHGEILAMSPTGSLHAAAVARATHTLVKLVGVKAIVWIQSSTQLSKYTAPQPDVALLKPRDNFYAPKLPQPQDALLYIEVADSSLKYDRDFKTELYAEAGIPEYWIADIQNDRLLVYSDPHGKTYRASRQLQRGERIAPQLLPDCEVTADDLLP